MAILFHVVPRSEWQRLPPGPYHADSLARDGFIHCSYRHQVGAVVWRFFAGQADLLVLSIDTDLLTSPVREEEADDGQKFPHVHGPINREAIVAETPFAAGDWPT